MLEEMTAEDERATLLYRSSDGATQRGGGGQGAERGKSGERRLRSNTNQIQKVETGMGSACVGELKFRLIDLHTRRSATYRPPYIASDVLILAVPPPKIRTSEVVLPRLMS